MRNALLTLAAGLLVACPSSSVSVPPAVSRTSMSQALSSALDVSPACETLPPSNSTFLYVSSSVGNDATAIVGDRTRPWQTIAGALAKVPATLNAPYAIEILDSSTYTETVNLAGKSASAANPLFLRTASGATPTLTGAAGPSVPVTVSTSYTTVEGLSIHSSPSVNGLVLSAATLGNSLLCNTFTGNAIGVISTAGAQSSLTLEGNRFDGNSAQAVSLKTGSSSLVFRRNIVVNNGAGASAGPAVELSGATSPSLVNNTFYNNSNGGTTPTATPDLSVAVTTGMLFKNNIFSSPSPSPIKRIIGVDKAEGTVASGSNYNLYDYPNVCIGSGSCPSCGDAFSINGRCTCFLAVGGSCGGVSSWQTQLNADTTGSAQGDPLFVAPDANPADLHELSAGGHFTGAGLFTLDGRTSPAVDTGDPADFVGTESVPNGPAAGGRINLGGYGGGPQASKTPGTRVVIKPAITKAGTPLSVLIEAEDATGAPVLLGTTYTANLTFPNNPQAVASPSAISIAKGTSSTTVTVTDPAVESVTPVITETTPVKLSLLPSVWPLTFEPTALTDVTSFTAVSGNGVNTLRWNNPSTHDGVLILRSTAAAPNTRPTDQTSYAVGAAIGNASVVYNDTLSFAQRMVDQGLTNGTRYYYRVFNHDKYLTYSAGSSPTASGLFSTPTSRATPSPLYCYSVGLPLSVQPTTELDVAVYTAGNNESVSANQTLTADPANDGQERWRPTPLAGAVQSRSPAVPLQGRSGTYLLVGDQAGFVYNIDSRTGAKVWTSDAGVQPDGGTALGNAIQAQVSVQLYKYSDTAFQTAHPNTDLVFVGTRNTSTTNNKVYALSSADGSVVWTYAPGNLDIISGGMLVDYTNDRLWVVSRSGGGAQPSLTVLNSITGARVTSFAVGDIDYPVNEDFASQEAYVTTNAGSVMGYDLATATLKFTANPGPMTAYAFPTGNGFVASLQSGAVQSYSVAPTTNVVTPVWANPVPIAGPSGIRILYTSPRKIFVGSSDGKVHQIDLASGTDEAQVVVSTSPGLGAKLGAPTVDTAANRLEVGALDGQMCVFQLPL